MMTSQYLLILVLLLHYNIKIPVHAWCGCSISTTNIYTSNSQKRNAYASSSQLYNTKNDAPNINDDNYNTTIVAGYTFRGQTRAHLDTIERQLQHPIKSEQVFGISTNLCKYGHPQAVGLHPTKGPKLVSGLFRLSCPLLCEAVDTYESSGGVRQMSDWLRIKDRDRDDRWKQNGYQAANEAQKKIRMELAKDDTNKLVEKMGEYNAQRFLTSGVAGIPPSQTYNVKCLHAHVADHLCRCSSSTDETTRKEDEEGNIIGEKALKILEQRGVEIHGNDVCWQQCNANRERLETDWSYTPKKNRQKLRSTRSRRSEEKKHESIT